MANPPTFLFIPPPLPPFPPDSPSDDLSPLGLVLGFITFITIPVLIYTIVFGVKCPPLPLRRSRQSSGTYSVEISSVDGEGGAVAPPEVNHEKESGRAADVVGGECPVCLSALSEGGEEIKRLSVCTHAFHSTCIDMWLESHSNCPVCRATIAVKKPNNPAPPPPPPTAAREVFRHQGRQHAADLV
ncbi:RING-H2 finger protein ATL33-like [Rhodamnia argentea]|uniref:RING-H2 finger protein ATL33-like n=1 Tax=Rhodamnia argentea TaxID=178133 RepID=A0A8B8P2G0_9MYRT|nr:RING-H2 finger protein ATL33-like [Rhodamnia argentea]